MKTKARVLAAAAFVVFASFGIGGCFNLLQDHGGGNCPTVYNCHT
ncbi:MAG: hypothetical protein ACHQIG_06625 [Acidimicrobiia bacterium]